MKKSILLFSLIALFLITTLSVIVIFSCSTPSDDEEETAASFDDDDDSVSDDDSVDDDSSDDDSGDDDSAECKNGEAKPGSAVKITGDQSLSYSYDCSEETDLPDICNAAWVEKMKAYCIFAQQGDPNTTVQDCVDLGQDLETCAEQYCVGMNGWNDYMDDPLAKSAIKNQIEGTVGACGYLCLLVTSFAYDSESEELPEDFVEMLFISTGGEMYDLDDLPEHDFPLPNPYLTCTDYIGLSKIKYRVAFPNSCSVTPLTYKIEADIGIDKTSLTVTMEVN